MPFWSMGRASRKVIPFRSTSRRLDRTGMDFTRSSTAPPSCSVYKVTLIYAMAFSGRESMANRVRPILVSEADRRELERLQRAPSAPAGLTRRARAVLLMVQGLTGVEIAKRTGYTVVQVSRVRRRFAEHGVAGLQDRPRSGRPPTITARKRAQVVALTLKPPPAGVTHWSTRELARTAGVSHGMVHRLWRAHALQPHRVSTFKFTTDPAA